MDRAALCRPQSIHICDGSEAEYDKIASERSKRAPWCLWIQKNGLAASGAIPLPTMSHGWKRIRSSVQKRKGTRAPRMVLAGRGTLMKGLDKALIKETGLPVFVAPNPLLAVCLGTGKALEYIDKFKKKNRMDRVVRRPNNTG